MAEGNASLDISPSPNGASRTGNDALKKAEDVPIVVNEDKCYVLQLQLGNYAGETIEHEGMLYMEVMITVFNIIMMANTTL
tara:strand:+ start:3526 stop:3768 length:243 start_codon:yes stop_codon:yes gene_type:complete